MGVPLGKLANGFTAPFTNITQAEAAALISGPTPVAFFTGNPADKFKYVFVVGRSEDAGARITVPFAEAQLRILYPSRSNTSSLSLATKRHSRTGCRRAGSAAR